MITVVVYASNNGKTIEWCLESLKQQDAIEEHEVVVIDDASCDQTSQFVRDNFPEFRLVKYDSACGWVEGIRKNLEDFYGDTIAFLGGHCRAHKGWLQAIEREMAAGNEIVSGMGHHLSESILGQFYAVVVHGGYLEDKPGNVSFLWDDNFAVKSTLLKRMLPKTKAILTDGAGATLASMWLRENDISIPYKPTLKIDHVTYSLGELIHLWYVEFAVNAIDIKLSNPLLPGAKLLWTGPFIAGLLSLSRLKQDIAVVLGSSLTVVNKGFCVGLAMLMSPFYLLGLNKKIVVSWQQIRSIGKATPFV
jgi:glycosyltransferase involved in cell wall biosynthesis